MLYGPDEADEDEAEDEAEPAGVEEAEDEDEDEPTSVEEANEAELAGIEEDEDNAEAAEGAFDADDDPSMHPLWHPLATSRSISKPILAGH